jgi:hypothetical protein
MWYNVGSLNKCVVKPAVTGASNGLVGDCADRKKHGVVAKAVGGTGYEGSLPSHTGLLAALCNLTTWRGSSMIEQEKELLCMPVIGF